MADVRVTDEGGKTMRLVEIGEGLRVCNFDRDADVEYKLVHDIKHFPCKNDDIFLLAPIKSGTHWTWEILNMLTKGRPETIPKSKCRHMLEHETKDNLSSIESPRILNSHLPIRYLPREMFEKKCKIVFVLRNPKDMLVSWYNHCCGIKSYEYSGKWEDFLNLFWENKLEYCPWFDYINDWDQFFQSNPSYPYHMLYYEDLQRNNVEEIRKLAQFIGKNEDNNELFESISRKCNFVNMQKDKMDPDELRKEVFNGDFTMYRKGITGDWKNWFTVSQSERFDIMYAKNIKDCSFKFQYS